MFLKSIRYTGYKNLVDSSLEFSPEINVLFGINGSGKTNLLDAIHFLSFTKSAFAFSDKQAIKYKEEVYFLEGEFIKDSKASKISCAYQLDQKKSFKNDGKEYKKLSSHLGKFPIIIFNPYDTDIIRGGSELRRKFVDAIISQVDENYLSDLIAYNSILKQKNQFLKNSKFFHANDELLLDTYDEKLANLSIRIKGKRQSFSGEFKNALVEVYKTISSSANEQPEFNYECEVREGDTLTYFLEGRAYDKLTKRSSRGIHRDDFNFFLNGQPIKKFGSQGQQKTYSISLRLSQYNFLKTTLGYKPLLLFDDLFDKLDLQRIHKILSFVQTFTDQQIFITDTSLERTKDIVSQLKAEVKYFSVKNGEIRAWEHEKK